MATEIKIIYTAVDNRHCDTPEHVTVLRNILQIRLIHLILIYMLVRMAFLSNISPFTRVFFLFSWLTTFGGGGAICTIHTIHLLIETIDLLIHTNGPPASSLWLPVDVSHPKKKPPSAAALVMAPDFASLAVLWWLPSINCSGLVQYLHSVYRSFVWQWQIFIGLPGRRILAIHWGWACLDSLLLCFEPHTLTHQCSGGM